MDQKTFFQRAAVVLWLAASANRLACGAKQYVPTHAQHEIGQARTNRAAR